MKEGLSDQLEFRCVCNVMNHHPDTQDLKIRLSDQSEYLADFFESYMYSFHNINRKYLWLM